MHVEGNYYKWLAVELGRVARRHVLAVPLLIPAFVWLYFKSKNASPESVATLCSGYYVVAKKILHRYFIRRNTQKGARHQVRMMKQCSWSLSDCRFRRAK